MISKLVIDAGLRFAVKRLWDKGVSIDELRAKAADADAWLAGDAQDTPTAGVDAYGVPALWVGDEAAAARGVVLYLHGGAFCIHLPNGYRRLAWRLAQATGMRVLLPDFPLYLSVGPLVAALAAGNRVMTQTHSGGVSVDDWGWHVFNHDLPFGGIGNSGMGTYHGEEGFRELSHAKGTFKRFRWFPMGLFYPPYGNLVQRLVFKFYLRRSDPTVAGASAGQPFNA